MLAAVAATIALSGCSSGTLTAAAYETSVAALKALLPLHQSLENGAPLNLGTLQTIVNRLQSIAVAIETTKGK